MLFESTLLFLVFTSLSSLGLREEPAGPSPPGSGGQDVSAKPSTTEEDTQ